MDGGGYWWKQQALMLSCSNIGMCDSYNITHLQLGSHPKGGRAHQMHMRMSQAAVCWRGVLYVCILAYVDIQNNKLTTKSDAVDPDRAVCMQEKYNSTVRVQWGKMKKITHTHTHKHHAFLVRYFQFASRRVIVKRNMEKQKDTNITTAGQMPFLYASCIMHKCGIRLWSIHAFFRIITIRS